MTSSVLVSLLTEVDDPRCPQRQHHSLESILLIATLAVICGADSFAFFGYQKQAGLTTFLELPHGIPSHDTFGRVFGLLDLHSWRPVLGRGGGHWPRRCKAGS